ncbi:MAG: VPDSG-CTERM sorting domain-containing protein [Opitutaceae bacterium]|nr:VPDSG-CTERM sorting domain-containing protein [Opitutaceae bacterium]
MKTIRFIAFVLLAAAASRAAVIYDQPLFWNGSPASAVGNPWNSHQTLAGLSSGFRAFDSFSLGSAATITQATWYGVYLAGSPLANAAPNTSLWSIGFFADAAGAPGAVLSTTSLSPGSVTQTLLGAGLFGANPVNVYQFTADLNSFDAAAGTTYWFSPLSQHANAFPAFGWLAAAATQDNTSIQRQIVNNITTNTFVRGNDQAFSLSGTVVGNPNPTAAPDAGSTLFLLGAGLAALGWLRRRGVFASCG